MKIHLFNTGAKYSHYGQRIAWMEVKPGSVVFFDKDRGIDGGLAFVLGKEGGPDNDTVLFRYRTLDYEPGFNSDLAWSQYNQAVSSLNLAIAAMTEQGKLGPQASLVLEL